MKVVLETFFDVSASRMFQEVQKTSHFFYITKGMVRFVPLSDLDETWKEGSHVMKMYLFGWIPFGKQTLHITYNAEQREMLDNGKGKFITKWNHLIRVEPVGVDRCKYTDAIEIEAGLLTFPVYLFARCFFRYRQTRWRKRLKTLHKK